MRTYVKLILATILLLGSAKIARAEAGQWHLNLAPGYASPMGDSSDYLKGSASIDASAMWEIEDWLAGGLEVGYIFSSKFEGTAPGRDIGDVDGDGINDPIGFTSDAHFSVLHFTPQIEIGPTLQRQGSNLTVHPYAAVGGGFYRTHTSGGEVRLTGTTSGGITLADAAGTMDSNTDTNGGVNFGGGLDFGLSKTFRLGVDVRYHRIIYDDGPDVEFLTPALRASWIF